MEGMYEVDDKSFTLHRISSPLQKLVRRFRKGLIAAFNSHSKQTNAYYTHLLLSLVFAFVAMMQGMSLVLPRTDSLSDHQNMRKVFTFINYMRVDDFAFDLGLMYEFVYVLLALIYAPMVMLLVSVGMYMYWKKKPNWLLVKAMNWLLVLIDQVLYYPALICMISLIKYTYFPNSAPMFEYSNNSDLLQSESLAVISCVTLPLLVGLLYLHSYFLYDNVFAKRRRLIYSMRDSFTHRMDVISRMGMVLCYSVLSTFSRVWYRLGVLLLCITMFLLFSSRLPYFNMLLNIGYSSLKALIAWSIIAYFIGSATDSATTIIILILFVSPVIICLIYYHLMDVFRIISKRPVREIATYYQLELKLRSLFETWESRVNQENTEKTIRQLFNFGTQNFPKTPLIPLWESLFYYYYKGDAFKALLKLSKIHVTELTLEAMFFGTKLAEKFSSTEVAPERQYFRYLKLLSEAKRTDESCCFKLVSVCSELLGRKVDARKFEFLVNQLSLEISKTMEKYFRILELYPDNDEVLQLLGSFMCDIVKEHEGRNFLLKGRMLKNSDARKLSNTGLFSDGSGLIVLSCCVQTQGEIILANQKIYEMFGYSKIDLHERPIYHFIPEEYRRIYTETMNNVVLFGHLLDLFSYLMAFLLDYDGFLVAANVTAKLTTWDNRPHAILTVTELKDTDWVLVDRDWVVKAHTCLDKNSAVHQRYIDSKVVEVLPGFQEHIDRGHTSFHFQLSTYLTAMVTIEKIIFKGIFYRLISLRHVSPDVEYTPVVTSLNGIMKDGFKEAAKEVRFHPEKPSLLHRTDTPPVPESSQTVLYTEAQARVNKKLELSTSLSVSTSTTVSYELAEGGKVGKSIKRVKLLLMLSFLLFVVGIIASVIFVTNILSSLESITTVKQYSQRNFEIVRMAYDARSLILSDSFQSAYNRQAVASSLESSTALLEKIIAYMKSNIGATSEADDNLLHQSVPMWVKLENNYQFRMQTLLDALYAYTAAGLRLASSPPPYAPLPDAYFLFRNGEGDLQLTMNKTLYVRIADESRSRLQSLYVITYLLFMCIALVVTPLVLLVLPQFYLFEQRSKSIWGSIYSLPIDSVLDVRTLAIERLQNYFSNEVFLDTATTTKATEREITPTKLWPGFATRLSVYLLVSLAFFVTLEVAYFIPLEEIAITIPNYLFWMSLRPLYFSESLFWTRENALLQDFKTSYEAYISEGQRWPDPYSRALNATSSITFINRLLLFGHADYQILSTEKSSAYREFLLSTTCDKLATEGCEDAPAKLGLLYMTKEWNQKIKAFLRSPSKLFSALNHEEQSSETAILALEYASDFYHSDAVNEIRAISVQIVTISVLFICLVFLLYGVLYVRYFTKLLTKTRQALRVHKLLRSK